MGHLGNIVANFGAILVNLRAIFGAFSPILELPCGRLGPSWAIVGLLGTLSGHLGGILVHLGAILRHIGTILGPRVF